MTLEKILADFAQRGSDAVAIGHRGPGDTWARLVWSNPRFHDLFGQSPLEHEGRRVELLFDPDCLEEVVGPLRDAIDRNEDAIQIESWVRRHDGHRRRVNAAFRFIPARDRSGHYTVATFRDVTDVRQKDRATEQALIEREALAHEVLELQDRFIAAINTLPGPLAIWDRDRRLVICNSAFAPRILGRKEPPPVGISVEDLLFQASRAGVFTEAVGREDAWYQDAVAGIYQGDMNDRTLYTDGRIFEAKSWESENGDMLIMSSDITDMENQRRQLEVSAEKLEAAAGEMQHKAFHDELTGLGNRRHLARLMEDIQSGRAGADEQIAVLQIDLDRFKQINDTLGHDAGDHVLCTVADRLRENVRASDLIARQGGDEFVVILRFSDLADVERLARRLVTALGQPVSYRDTTIRMAASVGVAHTPVSVPDALLVNADIALYRAKQGGRARARFFRAGDLDRMHREKSLSDDILRGLDADEFVPFFQPQVEAATGRLCGLEVLVRWRHPTRGVLEPVDFLAAVEELDRLSEIDRRMFDKAMALCENGVPHDADISLSFNLGKDSLMGDAVLAMARTGGEARFDVAFELLETIYLEDEPDALFLRLDALRDAGVFIEVDDFGSGRASIVALQRIAPDRLKIDRRLIAPVVDSQASRDLLRSIVGIGRALDIRVTAEGVETRAQAQALRDIGCDRLQGHYIAQVMDFSDIRRRYFTGDATRIVV